MLLVKDVLKDIQNTKKGVLQMTPVSPKTGNVIDSKFKEIMITILAVILTFYLSIGLTGCGLHHDDDDHFSDSGNAEINQGSFVDSTVQGLYYETDSQSGITDEQGSYRYMVGEMILFSMGGITLGETMAKKLISPIDLVPGATDETHPTVTNMLRFIQSFDLDNNPENGITLPPHILNELEGRPIHFDMDLGEFEHDADVQLFMNSIHQLDENYSGRMLVSIEDAQEHMRNTMMNMMNEDENLLHNDEYLMNEGIPGEEGMM
jgi:hypothetical protein